MNVARRVICGPRRQFGSPFELNELVHNAARQWKSVPTPAVDQKSLVIDGCWRRLVDSATSGLASTSSRPDKPT